MSRQRDVGTRAETAVVEFLQGHGFPYAERRALNGAKDLGDIAGVPGIAIEVKATVKHEPGAWLAEAERERGHALAQYAVVVHKPRGIGLARAGDFHVLMDLATFCELTREDI